MKLWQNSIPWPQIHDLLIEVGSERTVSEFAHGVHKKLGSLIHSEIATYAFFWKPSVAKDIFGIPEKWRERFVKYYSRVCPPEIPLTGSIDWDCYLHTEFTADFVKPMGLRHSIGFLLPGLPGNSVQISFHRSFHKGFTERERLIMNLLTPHLTNIHNYLNTISGLKSEEITAAETASGCRLLSKREAEVAALLCKRLNAQEIGTLLLLSPRTVERHISNVYEKLKVRNRRQLILKLQSKK